MYVMISASLASLTQESGPRVVKGDPSTTKAETPILSLSLTNKQNEDHSAPAPTFNNVSDSALKFTHIPYKLSPAAN